MLGAIQGNQPRMRMISTPRSAQSLWPARVKWWSSSRGMSSQGMMARFLIRSGRDSISGRIRRAKSVLIESEPVEVTS